MTKTILTYGLIGGVISTIGYIITILTGHENMTNAMIIGFASMFIAFSLIFVAIKSYRDKQAGGVISFGNAFKMSVLMSLITSSIYVIVWLIALYNFFPDFAQQYGDKIVEQMREAGKTAEQINAQIAENAILVENYKNPIMVILYTYMEILPIGLLFSLLAAAILKKKPQPAL
ncbi:DUF4199 domain-containing protein [Flavobacterium sp. C4GT6]|uniref:DUF4199 domain-containing protein n=1 Tax=Flavobacterium sp. C4GT6 TaxID=3103818 RepID=UPI002ED267B5|nr:DUF4199 domain-containing protein [Flavobacterium sp. C4GT6]